MRVWRADIAGRCRQGRNKTRDPVVQPRSRSDLALALGTGLRGIRRGDAWTDLGFCFRFNCAAAATKTGGPLVAYSCFQRSIWVLHLLYC